jgi:uncharacterized protein
MEQLSKTVSTTRRPARAVQIDAARGVAVFGILLVNIWSFVWGFGELRYGVMPAATWADRAAVFLVAFLAEQKFYPIFAFLFGAGFALQTRALRRRLPDWRSVRLKYRGRLTWLLGWGLLHGMLIWAGDILTVYGLTGFLLLRMAGARLSRIRIALWGWTAVWLLLIAVYVAAAWTSPGDGELQQQNAIASIDDALAAHAVYLTGTTGEVMAQRVSDYVAITTGSVFLAPHLLVLFLLGILAVRLGWLTRPGRHRTLWRRVRLVGLWIGLPFNLVWAAWAMNQAIDPLAAPPYGEMVFALLPLGGSLLAAAYLASVMLAQGAAQRILSNWLAPVGRMALSNYLSHSLIGVLLLQGAGLGLGAMAERTPALLMGVAAAIMLFQVLLSRWWLSRHSQGPIEALYARRA